MGIVIAEPGRSVVAPQQDATGLRGLLVRLADSAGFSYATIFLLQMKTVWGVWNSPRLGSGDTSSYFVAAQSFAENGDISNVVMSPLYSMLYGTVYAVVGDPFTATWVHRVVIVMAASLTALALFRRLLPPAIAWAVAAWWASSPIIFNTLYEVHLFGVLPLLAAGVVAAAVDSPWGRGSALAFLFVGGALARNELTAAASIFAVGCAAWEWLDRGRGPGAKTYLLGYAVPLAIAIASVLGVYSQRPPHFDMDLVMDHRHGLNMAQVFAFGYQQRNPEWTKSPWTESAELMIEHFGDPTPSIAVMLRRNPRATLEHFLWNLRLTPNGLQLLLFSEISGELNPDYPLPRTHSLRATVLTALLLALWLVGGRAVIRRWDELWEQSIRPRAPAWMVLISASLVAPLIILSQRPRPSYLFGLAAFLMAWSGLCATALVFSNPRRTRAAVWWPVVALALIAAVPRMFAADLSHRSHQVFTHVDRLQPHKELFSGAGAKLYTGSWQAVLHNYVCGGRCWGSAERNVAADEGSLARFLVANGFSALYIDEPFLQRLEAQPGRSRPFLEYIPAPWQLVDFEDAPPSRWRLFHLGDASG